MRIIRCLYLEDDSDDYRHLVYKMKSVMKPLHIELDFVRAETTIEADQKLEQRGSEFDVYFVDLAIGAPPNWECGLDTLDAAQRHPKLKVIGLTRSVGEPDTYRYFLRLLKTGYPYLIKQTIEEWSAGELRTNLMELLADVLEPTARLDWQGQSEATGQDHAGREESIKLNALVETVGPETLERLVQRIVPTARTFCPYYLTPGLSGAAVLRLEVTDTPPTVHSMLLKLSRDRSKLLEEIRNAPKSTAPEAPIYASYLTRSLENPAYPDSYDLPPWEYKGWYAIAMQYVGDAVSFQSWVTKHGTPAEVAGVMGDLFTRGLGRAYKQATSDPTLTPLDAIDLTSRQRARILHSTERLRDLLDSMKILIRQGAPRYYQHLLTDDSSHEAAKCPLGPAFHRQGTHKCWSHGDLHCQNILVEAGTPTVIDAGNRSIRHWAVDPARLCVDLWVSAWDHGPESHFWRRLDAWNGAIERWLEGGEPDAERQNPVPSTVLTWIRNQLPALFPGPYQDRAYADWQFRLAVAVQFLKFTTFEDRAMPKRCMALMAAERIIQHLTQQEA